MDSAAGKGTVTRVLHCSNPDFQDIKRVQLEEKEEEGMGPPTLVYGETSVYLQHLTSQLWMSYQVNEVTKRGVGKVSDLFKIMKSSHGEYRFEFKRFSTSKYLSKTENLFYFRKSVQI